MVTPLLYIYIYILSILHIANRIDDNVIYIADFIMGTLSMLTIKGKKKSYVALQHLKAIKHIHNSNSSHVPPTE